MRFARWIVVAGIALAGSAATPAHGAQSTRGKAIKGTVESIEGNTLKVTEAGNKTEELTLGSATKYVETSTMTKEDLKEGERVQAVAAPQPDGTMQALAIAVIPQGAKGVGSKIPPRDLMGQVNSGNSTATASSTAAAQQAAARKMHPIVGTLRSIQGDKITILTSDGARDVALTPTTRFVQPRQIKKDDVKQGDEIVALVRPEGSSLQVVAIRVTPPAAGASGTGSAAGGTGGSAGTSGKAQ